MPPYTTTVTAYHMPPYTTTVTAYHSTRSLWRVAGADLTLLREQNVLRLPGHVSAIVITETSLERIISRARKVGITVGRDEPR